MEPVRKYELLPVSTDESNIITTFLEDVKCDGAQDIFNVNSMHIHKMKDMTSVGECDKKSNNLMLMHGTSYENALEILNSGFMNSSAGLFGKGVYHTESVDVALHYSNRRNENYYRSDKYITTNCIFLNEIVAPNLQVTKFDGLYQHSRSDVSNMFHKHMYKKSPETTANDYRCDAMSRKYRCTRIATTSLADEYVADACFVKPRYYIELNTLVDGKKYTEFQWFLKNRFI